MTSDVVVLCYHAVSPSWPAKTTVAPAHLEEHLEDLVGRGYVGATFSDALTAPPADKTLVVTFDDAHASVGEYAVEAMQRLGLPGTMFVPTDHPGPRRLLDWPGYDVWLGTEHEHELRCMGWDDLRDLAAKGWEIGSHTCSHVDLVGCDDERLADELTRSRLTVEREIGEPCRSLAYPFGVHDARVARAARECGYTFAASIGRGPAQALPYRWPRIPMRNGQDAQRVRRRIAARRLVASPLGQLVRLQRQLWRR